MSYSFVITHVWSIELLQSGKNALNEVYNLIEANCMIVIWIKLVCFESFDTEGCLVLYNRVWIKYRHLNQIYQQVHKVHYIIHNFGIFRFSDNFQEGF